MKTIKELRIKLGLSQQALSEYLGITRSVLSMCESGRRILSPEVLVKLAGMETGLQQAKEKQSQVEYALQEESATYQTMLRKEENCRYKISKHSSDLEDMKTAHEQSSQLYNVLEYLSTQGFGENDSWITRKLTLTALRRWTTSETRQQKLINRINELSIEADALRGRLGSIKDPSL